MIFISEHVAAAKQAMPQALVKNPEIISDRIGADGWSLMGEMTVD
jgi:hypothetical protein